ncbi:MAG: recombinase family protein [Sphaerochaeta sp.]|nr:recombinase family protein [Sphaerochaeta sp.]
MTLRRLKELKVDVFFYNKQIHLLSQAGASGMDFVININDAEVVGKVLVLYEQGWSFLKIKKGLEALKVPTPTGKKKWPVKTIGNILTNEKYTGNSVYGETVADEFPATRRIRGISTEVHRSTNHHLVIIDE